MNRFIATFCLFFCWISVYASKKVTIQYSDGTIIEGISEKKAFIDGPMRISATEFEFSGEYRKHANKISGILTCGDYFAVNFEGTFYANEKANLLGKAPAACIPISDKNVVNWALRDIKYTHLLSVPDFAKEVCFLEQIDDPDKESTSGPRALFIRESYQGKAKIVFQNGNIYEGPIAISEAEGFKISDKQSDLMTFQWTNGDFWRGAGAQVTTDGICIPKDGFVTLAGTTDEIMYSDVADKNGMEIYIRDLYEQGKNPTEVITRLKHHDEAVLRYQENKKREEEQKKQAAQEMKKQKRKAACIQKYGEEYGLLVYNGKVKLGMTREMCDDALYAKYLYKKSEALIDGEYVEIWTYDASVANKQILSESQTKEEALSGIFIMSLIKNWGWTPDYTVLYFIDGKLVAYE